ncbi:YkgJ family cysteine cluster protein [Dehalogenimonas formicexedens]|nr:YkgJ family cysteine cluster protein [Dehalogenimonas formicexedens]
MDIRKIIEQERRSFLPSASPIIPSSIGSLTEALLEQNWDSELTRHGNKRIIGIPRLRFNTSCADKADKAFIDFIPLYLVASFLKCERCGQCCRPNYLSWDLGVTISDAEAAQLQNVCRITKRRDKSYLKYPCPLLVENQCLRYSLRPFGCRCFPFNRWYDESTGEEGLGILMHCPAARKLYVVVNLFLEKLVKGNRELNTCLTLHDLEAAKHDFESRIISEEDQVYVNHRANVWRNSIM